MACFTNLLKGKIDHKTIYLWKLPFWKNLLFLVCLVIIAEENLIISVLITLQCTMCQFLQVYDCAL